MATVRAVLQALESIAPRRYAFEFDRVGLQVGEEDAEVGRAVVALDRSLAAVERAETLGAQLLVAHHPLIFRPMDAVLGSSHVGKTILRLARSRIAFIAAHTNWDSAQGGINDTLCGILGVGEVRPFGTAAQVQKLKLVFFCPPDSTEGVIDALSEAGAGQIGLYRRCAFMHPGTGTFLGEEGSNPAIGQSGRIETVDELRVEMLLRADQRSAVERALRRTHPYEEPAFDMFALAEDPEQAAGRIGSLADSQPLEAFVRRVEAALQTRAWAWGDPNRPLQRVAVVGGAADDEWRAAQREGADVLLTGEVKQHNALEAAESGFALIAAGHYATEHPGAAALADRLRAALPEIDWQTFEPAPGQAGRPL